MPETVAMTYDSSFFPNSKKRCGTLMREASFLFSVTLFGIISHSLCKCNLPTKNIFIIIETLTLLSHGENIDIRTKLRLDYTQSVIFSQIHRIPLMKSILPLAHKYSFGLITLIHPCSARVAIWRGEAVIQSVQVVPAE